MKAQPFDFKYFPTVNFFRSLSRTSHAIFNPYIGYKKSGFCNRCVIGGANGSIMLSVPLELGRDQKRMMKEIRISSAEAWQKRHWKSIVSSYNRSPWFEFYRDDLEALFKKPFTFLIDWNYEGIEWAIRKLALPVDINVLGENDDAGEMPEDALNLHETPLENTIYYRQVFEDRNGFLPDLSILDLLFCEGKNASGLLVNL